MEYKISYSPTYSMLELDMARGEEVRAEPGAMVYMSPSIEIQSEMRGGLMKSLKRKALGGESFFINTFKANDKGSLGLAPSYVGDISVHYMDGAEFYIQSGSYLANSSGVEIDTKFAGAKGFFSREGLFLIKATGQGPVFLSSFGAIHEVKLNNESFILDTGHMVAFESTLDYNVKKIGGLKSTLLSGEGLVAEFHGSGKLFVQTRSVDSFIGWLSPHLPKRSGSY